MLTKNDFAKLEEKFVIKEEFHQETKSIKNLILEFKDAILKELGDMREEITLIVGYKDQIEDHETRLEKIEKQLHIPQSL